MSTEQEQERLPLVKSEALKRAVESYGVQISQGSTETILTRARDFESYLREIQRPQTASLSAPEQDAGNRPDAGPADLHPAGPKLSGSSRTARGSG